MNDTSEKAKPLTGNAKRFYTPLCCRCQKQAVWQIGAHIPFKSKAVFFCDEHLPETWRKEAEKQNV